MPVEKSREPFWSNQLNSTANSLSVFTPSKYVDSLILCTYKVPHSELIKYRSTAHILHLLGKSINSICMLGSNIMQIQKNIIHFL